VTHIIRSRNRFRKFRSSLIPALIPYTPLVILRDVHATAEHRRTKTRQGLAGLMLVFLSLASMARVRGLQGV
jgi:hypothetical protein